MTDQERELLVKIWGALRGVGMGAPLDMDYARELADALKPIAFDVDETNAAEAFAERAWSGNS